MENTTCGKREIYIPECSDCSKLEERVERLEECCEDVHEELDTKVDKEEGKGLSSNDFTDADVEKLDGIEDGAEANVQSDWDEADNTKDDYIKNKPSTGTQTQLSDGTGTDSQLWQASVLHDYLEARIQQIPADQFLDLNKTEFVNPFTWSSVLYPGSIDPNLDGKPVLVLALTDGTNTTYSFLNMEDLIDVYAGDSPIVVTGNTISHANSGVTSGAYGDTTNQTPSWGDTFKAVSQTVDAKGHTTVAGEHTVKIPNSKASATEDGLMSKEDKIQIADMQADLSAHSIVWDDTNKQIVFTYKA